MYINLNLEARVNSRINYVAILFANKQNVSSMENRTTTTYWMFEMNWLELDCLTREDICCLLVIFESFHIVLLMFEGFCLFLARLNFVLFLYFSRYIIVLDLVPVCYLIASGLCYWLWRLARSYIVVSFAFWFDDRLRLICHLFVISSQLSLH